MAIEVFIGFLNHLSVAHEKPSPTHKTRTHLRRPNICFGPAPNPASNLFFAFRKECANIPLPLLHSTPGARIPTSCDGGLRPSCGHRPNSFFLPPSCSLRKPTRNPRSR